MCGLLPACRAATEGTSPDCEAGCRISSQTSSKISAPLSWKSLLRSDEEKFKMFLSSIFLIYNVYL